MQPQFRGSVFSLPQASPADRVLAHIPPADQVILADFFKRFLLAGEHPFGFTLFGDKPLTLGPLYSFNYQTTTEHPSPDLIQKSLTFLKYQPLLGNNNFFFKIVQPFYYQPPDAPDRGIRDLMVLNRTACLNVIGKNLPLFQARFGPNATPQTILKQLEATDSPRDLVGSCVLYGILFGFGTANSQAFEHYGKLARNDNPEVSIKTPTPPHEVWIPLGNKKIRYLAKPGAQPSLGFRTAQAELDQLVQIFTFWPPASERSQSPIQAPIFRNLVNHPENQALTRAYLKQQADIAQIYQSPDLLKRVIQQLLQPAPTALQTTNNLATRQWVA